MLCFFATQPLQRAKPGITRLSQQAKHGLPCGCPPKQKCLSRCPAARTYRFNYDSKQEKQIWGRYVMQKAFSYLAQCLGMPLAADAAARRCVSGCSNNPLTFLNDQHLRFKYTRLQERGSTALRCYYPLCTKRKDAWISRCRIEPDRVGKYMLQETPSKKSSWV